ncbi:MAG: grasp-with-spasm system ATP-grasp peptide maturase [Bacteroidota bacterium]
MILFVGARDEASIHNVMDWLAHYGQDFKSVSHGELERLPYHIQISNEDVNIKFETDQKVPFQSAEVKSVWFRKKFLIRVPDLGDHLDKTVEENLEFYLKGELSNLKDGIIHCLSDKFWLGNPFINDINKTKSLLAAREAGFSIPATYIVKTKTELKELLDKQRLITKSIHGSLRLIMAHETYLLYTSSVNKEVLEQIPDTFLPTLVQSHIEKEIELRVFVLENKIYAMAIFSQLDEQTSTDFREYNWEKMNRMVPFSLPDEIQEKVLAFMKIIQLNTGSIDLILEKDTGRYVFLEINPTGQYGFVEDRCNYFLSREIAKTLIHGKSEST